MARRDPLNPLDRQIEVVQWTDSEIRRIARLSAEESERMVRTASSMRGAQARLANLNVQMWAGVADAVEGGIGDGVFSATEYQALFDEDLMLKSGVTPWNWRQQQLAQANQGVKNLMSRKENGITLSQRVWRNSQTAQKALNDTINVGLALNKSPREIASDVKQYINPNVPGGSSYAAMRLGRSEVLNAYHTTSVNKYKQTPWVEKVKWNLSGSHPRPDECNEYAESGNLAGSGIWSPDEVPGKPHPNCLCYVTPVSMDLDTYAKKFQDGEFDEYIDQQMGCARA